MSLPTGALIGPYEIVSLLGRGGMGEVYRARDPRLGRDVAIKVLPEFIAADRDGVRRFEQEARATAALNDPHIVAVHDYGTHNGAPFVVYELLEGEPLRARLGSPMAPRRAAELAMQIASGLAAAHARGIVHRDLKPENVFLTRDERAKILDFGVAKIVGPKIRLTHDAATTEPGTILGTAAYMSPEQVRGGEVDARSDIFALGSILYEMVSGRRAFEGETSADTISAILNVEPPDLPVSPSGIMIALERILRRCLHKNPDRRFQSASDVAFALEVILGYGSGPVPAESGASRRRVPVATAILAAALVAVSAAAGYLALRPEPARTPPSFRQLTFRRGVVQSARFTPDGYDIVYSASWEGRPFELFTTRLEGPESRALDVGPADILGISSIGEMAIALGSRGFGRPTGTLARAPLAGGQPREIAPDVAFADWSPDGRELAIARRKEAYNVLEYPAGHVLYQTSGSVSYPRISPDGSLVAFTDQPVLGDTAGALAVIDRNGNIRRLSSGWSSVMGVAWAPGGREIWYTATKSGGSQALHAIDLKGGSRVLAQVPGKLTIQDISRDGRVLVTRANEGAGIAGMAPGDTTERDLSWLDGSLARDLTPDGQLLLFEESWEGGGPNYSIYIRRMDGSPATRLGEGTPLALSHDGQWVVATAHSGGQLTVIPTGTGESRVLPAGPIKHYQGARWLPDNRRILIAGDQDDSIIRLFVQDTIGGEPRAVASGLVSGRTAISPDGRWAIGRDKTRRLALFPLEGGEPRAIPGAPLEGVYPASWSADGRSLFIYRTEGNTIDVQRVELATGRRETWKTLRPADKGGFGGIFTFVMTPDGRAYAYTYIRALSELHLLEGIR